MHLGALASLLLLATGGYAAPPRPNIILVLADDLGWSDLGCYGGEIRTPNLDRLAAEGIRFTQFYNSAKCEPTRASLMSGQYWQDCGQGIKQGITMGQALRAAGYATFVAGKWHLDGNPVERGFDRYFGHLSGASDYFKGNASHRLDDQPFKPDSDKFYTTDANADFAIQFIEESRAKYSRKPFFLYLAFNAPHAPLQAWPEDIAKYRGQYRIGWDQLREQRYRRMIELGVFNKQWALAPRPDTVPAWASLKEEAQDFEDLRMAIYAAMVDRMDQALGRVLARVKELGIAENTLVMFLSDNGGSPFDRGRSGTLPARDARWEYGLGWAHASNTPFRHFKRNMFNGGACTPFIAHWPRGITATNVITDQRAHIIDLMATVVDLAGWPWPAQFDGKPLGPLPGRSLRPIFAGGQRPAPETLYFHLLDHRAVIAGDWKLVSDWGQPWSLFNLANDRTELRDRSKEQPAQFDKLTRLWTEWWSDKNPGLFKSGGGEPVYRHLDDTTEATQRGTTESDEPRPARKARGKKAGRAQQNN